MPDNKVNPNKVYFDSKGKIPTVAVEGSAVQVPDKSSKTHPKLITDTTLRDGAQDPRVALFHNDAKLKYFDLLHQLDNGTGCIEAVEVFIYQKRDIWTLEKLLERGYSYPQVTTWTRAIPKDIKALIDISGGKIKETGMLASCSDHHIFDKMGFRSKDEAIEKYLAPILTACEHNIRPRVHLEDATKADVQGWVIPFIERVLKETGGLARFRICDTVGVGIPDPYVSIPFGIPRLVSTIIMNTGAELEFHGHNDFGMATANSMAALAYGCKRVNTAFAGLGERTGNTPLEQVLANYIRIYGDPGFKLSALTDLAELINREVAPVIVKQPIVGSDIFTTHAGLHQTGVARQSGAPGGLIYLPYDPLVLGRETLEFNRIGSLSGMDGIVAILNSQWEMATGEKGRFNITSRIVKRIYDYVQDAYDGNLDPVQNKYINPRTTFFEGSELLEMAKRELATTVKQ